MPWANGTSRTSTPEWNRTRERARTELPYECAHAHRGPCAGSLELDHRTPHAEGGTDTLDNLQWLCKRHHAMKSQKEAKRGKARRASRGMFDQEAHPGIIT
ncbi:HNH endonuclease [Corynebacterium glyciniphilum]|uniref:HNH endonuclease n=1 Tax=Corynebacterium glyciniphilum TaxID=1404244 RepID=UPI003FD42439